MHASWYDRQGAIVIVMFTTSSSRNTIIKRKKGWCHVEKLKYGRQSIYQWMVTLYRALLTTLTTRVSPLFTSSVGPGNIPLTVMEFWVLHSLFTGVAWIWTIAIHKNIIVMVSYYVEEELETRSTKEIKRERETYNKIMVVTFGICQGQCRS